MLIPTALIDKCTNRPVTVASELQSAMNFLTSLQKKVKQIVSNPVPMLIKTDVEKIRPLCQLHHFSLSLMVHGTH